MFTVQLLSLVVAFALISLASNDIGQFFSRWKLPLITGFLATGVVSGPYVLDLITAHAVENLLFVDQISLAVIAFAAGSELYLKEMRSRLRSIAIVTASQVIATFTLGSLAVFLLAGLIPFLQDMSVAGRIAVSLLMGAILVARSPSSAIAIVNELRAKGPFTHTALGVTVIIDVLVIVLFSINFSIADGIFSDKGFDVAVIALLLGEIVVSIGLGISIGLLIDQIHRRVTNIALRSGSILLLGYGVFYGAWVLRDFSHHHLAVSLHLEPLLICMVAAFWVTNFTRSRVELARTLRAVAPAVYVAFFTLVGASLELDVVVAGWYFAVALVIIRLVGIFVGAYTGGTLANDPPAHNRIAWMTYITQAGVALGLAKGVAAAFPDWGPAFATLAIAVIVINQVIGPPFFKLAIFMADEAHIRAGAAPFEGVRSALIVGVEGQSLALAQVLNANNWQVKLAGPDVEEVEQVGELDITINPLPRIDEGSLRKLGADRADAIVTLLSDDENFETCELAYENFGTRVLLTRLRHHENRKRFEDLGVMVIDPATAMVSLLDRCVRSPKSSALFLGEEEELDVVDVEVGNPDIAGLKVSELRLPLDVAVLYVYRDGLMLSSTGMTRIELGDILTLSGPTDDVDKAVLKLEA